MVNVSPQLIVGSTWSVQLTCIWGLHILTRSIFPEEWLFTPYSGRIL